MQNAQANVRSLGYYIAQAGSRCARCNGLTAVMAVALPPHHETLEEDQWQRVAASAILFQLADLLPSVAARLARVAPGFQLSADGHWENHCEHCGGRLSEEQLHCEIGGFMPGDEQQAAAVLLVRIDEPFAAAAAGYSLEPEFFEHMRLGG
jgi:hypothetical protein